MAGEKKKEGEKEQGGRKEQGEEKKIGGRKRTDRKNLKRGLYNEKWQKNKTAKDKP